MKITQKSSVQKRIIIVSSALVVLLAGGVTLAYMNHLGPFHHSINTAPTTNLKPATTAQKQAGEQQKKQTAIPNEDTKQNPPQSATPSGSTASLAVSITALSQNGTVVQARSLIESVITDGTCTLTLTKGATTVTKTSDIHPLSSSSTCEGFDIPTSELSAGTWQVNLTVTSNGASGNASGKITVQ